MRRTDGNMMGSPKLSSKKKDSLGTRAVVIEYEKVVMFAHPSGTHEFMWTRLRFIIHLQLITQDKNRKRQRKYSYYSTLTFAIRTITTNILHWMA